jgi:hypothetical protein
MTMMTKREVFDRVREHLLTQGQRCSLDGACYYRLSTPTQELRCAVGCLIADEHYSHALEGYGPRVPRVREVLSKSGVPMDEPGVCSMLEELQSLHDENPIDSWEGMLGDLERDYFYV